MSPVNIFILPNNSQNTFELPLLFYFKKSTGWKKFPYEWISSMFSLKCDSGANDKVATIFMKTSIIYDRIFSFMGSGLSQQQIKCQAPHSSSDPQARLEERECLQAAGMCVCLHVGGCTCVRACVCVRVCLERKVQIALQALLRHQLPGSEARHLNLLLFLLGLPFTHFPHL